MYYIGPRVTMFYFQMFMSDKKFIFNDYFVKPYEYFAYKHLCSQMQVQNPNVVEENRVLPYLGNRLLRELVALCSFQLFHVRIQKYRNKK